MEHLWAFGPGVPNDISQLEAPQVNGTYVPVTADHDANGLTDIAWNAGTTATVWRFGPGGYSQQNVMGLPARTLPVTVEMDVVI